MNESILLSDLYAFLKKNAVKILLISVLVSMVISLAMVVSDKKELIFESDSTYIISHSEDVNLISKNDLIDFLASDEENLQFFLNNRNIKDYSVYNGIITEIIHSDWLYEKVKSEFNGELTKAQYDVMLYGGYSGAGRLLELRICGIDKETCQKVNDLISKHLSDATKKYFNCEVQVLEKTSDAKIVKDTAKIDVLAITGAFGHNYVEKGAVDIVKGLVRPFVLSFAAILLLVVLLYTSAYVFRYGRHGND